MTFAEVHVKRSVILPDHLDPDILLVLRVKGQVLHRERAHLKMPPLFIYLYSFICNLKLFTNTVHELSLKNAWLPQILFFDFNNTS